MLTVIFSSLNGEATLARMLEACCGLIPPDGGWKLVAVDNGSTDRTAHILRAYRHRLPIEIITVASRGKNRALNEAIGHAEGDLIVFTDDDVIPDRQWLRELEACAQAHPAHELISGPILPCWPHAPDAWILDTVPLGMVYALTAPGQAEGEVCAGSVWGPNMAVRKSLFDRGARFNAGIGPDGSNIYMMGSETEFTRRLARAGAKAWFCSTAQVEHIIRAHQLSTRWILERFFRHGRSAYAFEYRGPPVVPTVFGVERWLYAQLVSSRLRALGFRLLDKRKEWFDAMQLHYSTRGRIHQARLMLRRIHDEPDMMDRG